MDRLKFRVWDKPLEKYMEFKEFKFMNVEFTFNPITKEAEIEYDKERYIIEQCTGIKDKNGKLIYEGDIVKIFCCRRPYGYLGRTKGNVYWSNPDAEFRIKVSLEEEYNLYGIEIEVIGNIHENADLLGEE